MSNLSKLKIVAQAAKRQQTKSEHRRGKLLEKLGDQLAMIEAQINGDDWPPSTGPFSNLVQVRP